MKGPLYDCMEPSITRISPSGLDNPVTEIQDFDRLSSSTGLDSSLHSLRARSGRRWTLTQDCFWNAYRGRKASGAIHAAPPLMRIAINSVRKHLGIGGCNSGDRFSTRRCRLR